MKIIANIAEVLLGLIFYVAAGRFALPLFAVGESCSLRPSASGRSKCGRYAHPSNKAFRMRNWRR